MPIPEGHDRQRKALHPNAKDGVVGDCVARAISAATGMHYPAVLHVCKLHGWTERSGMDLDAATTVANKLIPDIKWKGQKRHAKTVTTFCRAHNKGRFIVSVSGHWIAVVDGVPQDHADANSRHRIKIWAEVA